MKNNILFVLKHVDKKHLLIWGYLAIILESASMIAASFFQKDLIDRIFYQKQYHLFSQIICLYGVFYFGPKLFFSIRKILFFDISYQVQGNLTKEYIKKIHSLPLCRFEKLQTGELMNQVRNNIADVSDIAANQIMSELIKNIYTIILLVISIGWINIRLAFTAIIFVVIYNMLIIKYGAKTRKLSKDVKDRKGQTAVKVIENITSMKEAIAYNLQKWQIREFEKSFYKYEEATIQLCRNKNIIMLSSGPLLYLIKIACILVGSVAVINNRISIGEFIAVYTLTDQFTTEMGLLFDQSVNFKKLQASIDCIAPIIYGEEERYGSLESSDQIKTLCIKNLTFKYSENSEIVLDNISMDLPIGKKIAIVGESGSGKSTIANLLLRLYRPTQGNIFLNGISIFNIDSSFYKIFSMVFQSPHFFPATVLENLNYGCNYEDWKIEQICNKMACDSFIFKLPDRYNTYIGEKGSLLSGGQKQRLALVKSLLREPEILVLDEATSALDMHTEFEIQKNLDELREGKTTIIIAHRLMTIQNADRIYMLEKGKIAGFGTHNELMQKCIQYKRLYTHQSSLEAQD